MEISALAAQISMEQMAQLYEQQGMGALKGAIEVQAQVQGEITAMIQEVMPHLAQNVDLLV